MNSIKSDGSSFQNSILIGGFVLIALALVLFLGKYFLEGIAAVLSAVLIGLAAIGAGFAGGAVGGVVVAGWAVHLALAGIALWAGSMGVTQIVKVHKEVEKRPFVWAVPLFAIFAGFNVDLAKDYYDGSSFEKAAMPVFSAVTLLVGGYIYGVKRAAFQVLGALLICLPSLLLFSYIVLGPGNERLIIDIQNASPQSLSLVAVLFTLSITFIVVARRFPSPNDS